MVNLGAGLYSCLPPMLIHVVMFGCIIAGSLCSLVSVLSCTAACYVVADYQLELRYEINELLL